jgi:hypothetical protein
MPPKVKKKDNQEDVSRQVVKCGLSGHLYYDQLLEEIDTLCVNISKISNRGSLIFEKLLHHCIENNKSLPDFKKDSTFVHCFTVGIKRFGLEDKLTELVYQKYFSKFPLPEQNKGDNQVITYAARKYKVNFFTYLVETFEQRQKKLISEFCKRNGLDKEQSFIIRYKINNWKTNKDTILSQISQEFITFQKKLLKIKDDEEVTKMWLKKNINILVNFNYECLKQFEKWNLKLFSLAPISSIRKNNIVIDSTVLYYLLKNNGLVGVNYDDFIENKDYYWGKTFNIKNLNNGEFAHYVETDGISLCVHFLKSGAQYDNNNLEEIPTLISESNRVISIDPGRTNLIYGVENNTDKTFKLTRRQYYHQSGMTKATKQSQKWNRKIEDILTKMSITSVKTTSEGNWNTFIKTYTKYYNKLWNHYTQNKWNRQRFGVYIKKNKCLDTFFASMRQNNEPKPIIAYGAAKFNPSNKNELSAPTTFLSKKCSKFYQIKMIDEYNTTKMCSNCGSKLESTFRMINGKCLEVRGLKWCSSTTCSKFVNRDHNAALNILKCFLGGKHRPHSLTRNPRLCGSTSQSRVTRKLFISGKTWHQGRMTI